MEPLASRVESHLDMLASMESIIPAAGEQQNEPASAEIAILPPPKTIPDNASR
jgi:hypothetical protein